jgi:putative DNA primase/helicase
VTTILDSALALAAMGLPVFPCSSANKRPCCEGGFKSASTDPDTIARLFADPRAALIGVPTGDVSGFDVLDIDPAAGGGEWLAEHESSLPTTCRHHTRSSGIHFLFAHTPGLRNSASKIAPGVDIRADGGYIIYWPAHGFHAEGDTWATCPDFILVAALRARTRGASAPAPADLSPGSAADLVALLHAMPNPPETTRDDYVALNLSVQGCCRALEHLDRDWCSRWESERASDFETERSRWESDWGVRTNDVSGWRHVLGLADRLGVDTSAQRHESAVSEFGALPESGMAPSYNTAGGPTVLDPAAPLSSAKQLVRAQYSRGDLRTLHRHGGEFWEWTGTHYAAVADAEMRAAAYRFLDGAVRHVKGGALEPFNPNRSSVSDTLDALSAAVQLRGALRPPSWFGAADSGDPPAAEITACDNGLLHLPTRRLLPHTPRLFNQYALEYSYQADAPAAIEWPRFLHMLWPDDAESVGTLQEIFGLLLTADTRYQKLFLLVGPKRSGKGTIARVLSALLGEANACAPTLAGLGTNFGLQPLIGKLLAIIGDARLSGRADVSVIAERLLSISGEDNITIDRKYLDAWTGKLPTRFLLMSNELPRLSDASGALASRFILLQLRHSFYGREDMGLTARLLSELPSILNWALAGLDRLRARGYFVQPASARQAVDELEELASPIGAFLAARCIVGTDERADCDAMYTEWVGWCREQGRAHAGSKPIFSRDLRAAVSGLQTTQARGAGGDRRRVFHGVGLIGAESATAANDHQGLQALVVG